CSSGVTGHQPISMMSKLVQTRLKLTWTLSYDWKVCLEESWPNTGVLAEIHHAWKPSEQHPDHASTGSRTSAAPVESNRTASANVGHSWVYLLGEHEFPSTTCNTWDSVH